MRVRGENTSATTKTTTTTYYMCLLTTPGEELVLHPTFCVRSSVCSSKFVAPVYVSHPAARIWRGVQMVAAAITLAALRIHVLVALRISCFLTTDLSLLH